MVDVAPYFTGLGCTCDPFDDGPFGHDPDCPADKVSIAVKNEWEKAAPLLADLAASISDQDRRYGRFDPDVKGLRLAVAALEDEAEEVRHAWRAERKTDGWDDLRAETLQVAAVAIRILRDTLPRREAASVLNRSRLQSHAPTEEREL